jgi:hypothetical protein
MIEWISRRTLLRSFSNAALPSIYIHMYVMDLFEESAQKHDHMAKWTRYFRLIFSQRQLFVCVGSSYFECKGAFIFCE